MKSAIYLLFFSLLLHSSTVITYQDRFFWRWFRGQREETFLSLLQSSRRKSCTFIERHRNFLYENLFGRDIPIESQCTWDTASSLPEILNRIYMGSRLLAFCVLIAIVSFVYFHVFCNALWAIDRDEFALGTDEEEDVDNNDETLVRVPTKIAPKLIDHSNIKKDSDQKIHVLRKVEFTWPWGPREVLLSGSFVGWSTKLRMFHSKNAYRITLMLPRGHHEFKFLVDNRWCLSNSKGYRKCKGVTNDERNYIHVK